MFDWVEHVLVPWAARVSDNRYMKALRDTFYRLIPMWLVLSFFRIVQWAMLNPDGPVMGEDGMGLGAFLTGGLYEEEYQATAFYQLFDLFSEAVRFDTTILLSFLTMTLAIQLTKIWGGDKSLASFCALGGFFMFLRLERTAHEGVGVPSLNIPAAFVIAALSARMLAWLDRFASLRLRVPEGVPERVSKPLSLCLPTVIVQAFFLILFMAFANLVTFFSAELDTFVTFVLRPAAQSLPFALLYEATTWFLWWIGLLGEGFTAIIHDFAYLPAQAANQAAAAAEAFAAGGVSSRAFIFTSEFFATANAHVLALAAAILAFSHNEKWRRVTKFLLLPLAFNIQAPLLFCLPVVLNSVFLLPFLLAPLANTIVAWTAISWGLVPVFKFTTADTVPIILQGVLGTGSPMGGVLQVVVLILDIFIYAPFVIVANRIEEARGKEEDAP